MENSRGTVNNGVMHRIWDTLALGCGSVMPLAISRGQTVAASDMVLIPAGALLMGSNDGPPDMAGNGWEWVISACLPYPYDPKDGREDLTREQVRGTREGGHDSGPEELTTTRRERQVSRNPHGGHHNIGFRCAR